MLCGGAGGSCMSASSTSIGWFCRTRWKSNPGKSRMRVASWRCFSYCLLKSLTAVFALFDQGVAVPSSVVFAPWVFQKVIQDGVKKAISATMQLVLLCHVLDLTVVHEDNITEVCCPIFGRVCCGSWLNGIPLLEGCSEHRAAFFS